MKYIEKYDAKKDKPELEAIKYNSSGQHAEENDTIYAECKEYLLRDTAQKQFYVLTSNGNLLDPKGTDSHRINTIRKELKKTNKNTFEYYVQYLQTKSAVFLRRAERSYING